ncbi:endonuclease/exonuclease/phosphatase family protein [Consotaella salsifontis]|uniref:Metal-dependent hydrolase, endonuclease/exonuclease/phosphatase family n=1 Tax=Consotaella salsifontis TaxID=1365950 RepID=A0A1T4RDC2_9HYPH|nr:endonuclease/exonuclease/phosphatase family protein [Consotaella salsifontis]SKA13887.1 Metal-dependent hydrolase, endonuclease/exonuclease/phosphatase family [Consotaella salsifontis]
MIRVASYNIRKSVGTDWRRQPRQILDVLSELDADIIALQEVDRRFGDRVSSLAPQAIAERTAYKALRFGVRPDSLGWHGNTILVRKEMEVLRCEKIVLPALEPRGAALADIRAGDVRVRVVGMHLGLVSLWRRRQARAVLQQLKRLEEPLPTVMMGDLNEWNTEGGCLTHFAEEHHVVAPGPSFHSHLPFASFDRIITSPEIKVQDAGVHLSERARIASDHLPVWAELAFPAEAVAATGSRTAVAAD